MFSPRRVHGFSAAAALPAGAAGAIGAVAYGLEHDALHDVVHLQVAALNGDLAGEHRLSDAPVQLQRRVDGEPAEIVPSTSKRRAVAWSFDIAGGKVRRAQAADDVERIAVGVLDVKRVDRDAIAREAERRAPVLVADAGGGDDEPGAGHRDAPLGVRRAAGAGEAQRERRRARHAADLVGQALDEREVDPARRDGDVERPVGRGGRDRGERHGARGGQPRARRLVEPQIDVESALVVASAARTASETSAGARGRR